MKKLTVLNKKARKNAYFYQQKALSNARHIRDTTLSMKCGIIEPICKIDLETFTNIFFSDKTPIPYSRLQPPSKLLVCQYVLHNHDNNMVGVPFVFRPALDQRDLSKADLNRIIQRRLSSSLNRSVLFWSTRENDGKGYDRTITHLNGEILVYPDELEKLRHAFKELYLHEQNKPQNKPIEAHSGTKEGKPVKKSKKSLNHAIRLPLTKRNLEASKRGMFYSVLNWVGYSTKQDQNRDRERFKCRIQKIPMPKKENFHYIQSDLNKLASQFYSENILKNGVTLNNSIR